jgi:nucleoside-diphosphate-sugar epimerase
MKKNILITGASGFTGWHACKYFSQKGYRVTGISRIRNSSMWKFETCDLLNRSQIFQIVKKHMPDYCLHLAGINSVAQSWTDPLSAMNINVIGTLHLLEAIRQIKPDCRTLITGSALSGTKHPYAVSKQFQQKLSLDWASLYDLSVMVAKPSNLIGPGPSSGFVSVLAERIAKMEKINKAEPIAISHLENAREFLDVRDAVSAYEILLKKGTVNTTYEIGSGQRSSLSDITEIYQSLTDFKLTFMSVNSLPDHPPDLMDTGKMKELDWQPHFSLKESIAQTLSYYRTCKD